MLSATVDYEQLPELQVRLRSTSSNGSYVEKPFAIQVQNVNESPTAFSQTTTTAPGTAKAISLLASDPEQSSLIYTVTSCLAMGLSRALVAFLTYAPSPGFVGARRLLLHGI